MWCHVLRVAVVIAFVAAFVAVFVIFVADTGAVLCATFVKTFLLLRGVGVQFVAVVSGFNAFVVAVGAHYHLRPLVVGWLVVFRNNPP